jgi:Tol biopolymer transport system component
MNRVVFALGSTVALVVFAAVTLGIYVNNPRPDIGVQPTATPSPTASSSPGPSPFRALSRCPEAEEGTLLDCSRDGTRLLIQKGDGNLFVLHADGSETQVTEDLSALLDLPGSSRPRGATISPEGSRVVFAGLKEGWEEGLSCHNGALFAVQADGGPAEVLWTSHNVHNGLLNYPTFSPDGTQIAFADGYCDNDHSVWVMNADGSDAHQIVSSDTGPLGGGHVYGLAWSSAGDRIALLFSGVTFEGGPLALGTYTFATDGSDFMRGGADAPFCWAGRQC